MPQFDPCQASRDFGLAESGRITGEILKRQIDTPSVFRDRMEKEEWTDGVGFVNTYRTYNPQVFEATSDVEMADWTNGSLGNDGNGNPLTAACDPPLTEVPLMGIQDRTFNLQVKGFKTPVFCAMSLKTKHEADEMLKFYYDTLGKNSHYFIERQVQNAYTAASVHKVIATGTGVTIDGALNSLDGHGHTVFPAVAPLSILTQGTLDNIKTALNFQVSSAPNMLKSSGQIIYDLLTDDLTSTALVQQNAGLLESYRFAYEGNTKAPTIQGVGAYQGMVVAGFRHLYCRFPARWDLVSGQWVRIRPFAPAPSLTTGPQNVTRQYQSAPFQDSYVFVTNVIKMVVRKPIPRVGPAVFQTPIKDYAGDNWNWYSVPGMNGCNMEGTSGFWFTFFRFGFKEIDPQCGWIIRHRRCDMPDSAYGCGSSFSYGNTTDGGLGTGG